jgi:pSer/pThr/pTyr-binding forkhead associated (FHA) protein
MLFNLSNNSDTMLNGEPVAQAALKAGDVITLATTHLIFAVDRSDPDFGADTCLPHDHTMPIRPRSDAT